jgi:hypothetical protein
MLPYVCADAVLMQGKSLLLMKGGSSTPPSSPTRWNLSTSTCSPPTFSRSCPGASPCRPLKSTHASTSQSLPSSMVLFLRSHLQTRSPRQWLLQRRPAISTPSSSTLSSSITPSPPTRAQFETNKSYAKNLTQSSLRRFAPNWSSASRITTRIFATWRVQEGAGGLRVAKSFKVKFKATHEIMYASVPSSSQPVDGNDSNGEDAPAGEDATGGAPEGAAAAPAGWANGDHCTRFGSACLANSDAKSTINGKPGKGASSPTGTAARRRADDSVELPRTLGGPTRSDAGVANNVSSHLV